MNYLIISLDAILLLIIGAGIFYIQKQIKQPVSDACALMGLAYSLKNICQLEKNFLNLHPLRPEDHFGTQLFWHYNLFLNIIKRFPIKQRFAWMQGFNWMLYLGTLAILFYIQNRLGMHYTLEMGAAIRVSLLFTLLMALKSRLLFVVALGLSDVLNYFLFMVSVLIAFQLTVSSSIWLVLVMGFVNGLSFRNRNSDIVLLGAGSVYLFYLGIKLPLILVYFSGFLLSIIDLALILIFNKNKIYDYWKHVIPSPSSENTKKNSRVILLVTSLREGLKKIFNFYSEESLWISLGSTLLVLPVSIVILVRSKFFRGGMIYLALFFLGYCFIYLFLKQNVVQAGGKRVNRYLFSGRQMYILLPVLFLINSAAFVLVWVHGNTGLLIVYLLWIVFYIAHQVYRLLSYYFEEFISETVFLGYAKVPPPWGVELTEIIKKVKKPAVIMGSSLVWGEAHNFCYWDEDIRCINILKHITDQELVQIIEKYKVTHIAITPSSTFNAEECGLSGQKLSPLLQSRIKKLTTSSPQLTVYETLT